MTTDTNETAKLPLTLTYDEAAVALGLSTRQLQRLVRDRRIGHVKMGRRVGFRRCHLEAYLDAVTVAPVAPAALDDATVLDDSVVPEEDDGPVWIPEYAKGDKFFAHCFAGR